MKDHYSTGNNKLMTQYVVFMHDAAVICVCMYLSACVRLSQFWVMLPGQTTDHLRC